MFRTVTVKAVVSEVMDFIHLGKREKAAKAF
jgi:hypothetical protein